MYTRTAIKWKTYQSTEGRPLSLSITCRHDLFIVPMKREQIEKVNEETRNVELESVLRRVYTKFSDNAKQENKKNVSNYEVSKF